LLSNGDVYILYILITSIKRREWGGCGKVREEGVEVGH
jgi:hypothetical protein